MQRVGNHPDRIENMYFLYAMLLEAVGKLDTYLDVYTYCTGNKMENLRTKVLLKDTVAQISQHSPFINLDQMFKSDEALKEEFKSHFRNVSMIMDCVTCEKCRLWGKIQISGIGTALKILFSFDPHLHSIKKQSNGGLFASSSTGTK